MLGISQVLAFVCANLTSKHHPCHKQSIVHHTIIKIHIYIYIYKKRDEKKKEKLLTIRSSTIHLIMPNKKALTQRINNQHQKDHNPIPYRLSLFINRLKPLFMTHGSASPQHEIVIFPSEVNEIYPWVRSRYTFTLFIDDFRTRACRFRREWMVPFPLDFFQRCGDK